jgi:Cysteine rich repeat
MMKLLSTTTLLEVVFFVTLLIGVTLPNSTYSAESPNVSPKDGSSHTEQSPEEAAGGKEHLQRMRQACDQDVKKLCPDIRPGGGRILQCLRGQESNLSPACRQVLAPHSSKP